VLSRERILQAGLAIVDRDGLDAVSMRRLGDELSVEAMSLYNHVANKAAILDGIFETILAELPTVTSSGDWRQTAKDQARALRAVLRAHPNALPVFATRPAVTLASIARVEAFLGVLVRAGFSLPDALRALQVLSAYVVGHTIASYVPRRPDEESRPAYDRLSRVQFPYVREMARLLPRHDVEEEFEFGMDALIGGLERHLQG
jgi:AcrR family transcriptional regulator